MSEVVRLCAGCHEPLGPQHLRVQLAPPHEKWREVRVHHLTCLLDFLEDEEEKLLAGHDGEVFKAGHLPAEGTVRP